MSEQEKFQRELIKKSLNLAGMNNPIFTPYQKPCVVDEIDKNAKKAD